MSVRAQVDEALLTVRAEPLRLDPLRLEARLPAARLTVAEGTDAASPSPVPSREATGEGRVDFVIVAGE